jgi:hypothetical protein
MIDESKMLGRRGMTPQNFGTPYFLDIMKTTPLSD